MSLAVTSSMTWCALRPLIAANMARIIGTSLPFRGVRPPQRGPAGGLISPSASCDDGAVDVGEDVVLHVVVVDRRDHGPVADRDDERGPVDEHDGVAAALRRRALEPALKPRQR